MKKTKGTDQHYASDAAIMSGKAAINRALNWGIFVLVLLLGMTVGQQAFAALNFAPGTSYQNSSGGTTQYPYTLAVGRFNNDALPDIAVPYSIGSGVGIFTNSSGTPGTFSTGAGDLYSVFYPIGSNTVTALSREPYAIATADFDGDGNLDLATSEVVGVDNYRVVVLKGLGNGSFQAPLHFVVGGTPTYGGPIGIVSGDFNGDGKPDLAVTVQGLDHVSVLLNTTGLGTISFATHVEYATAAWPTAIGAGDLDHDGRIDLVVQCAPNGTGPGVVSILRGNGDGTFKVKEDYPGGNAASPIAMAVADLSGDGFLDIATVDKTYKIMVALHTGNSGAAQMYPSTYDGLASYAAASNPYGVVAADMDGDGSLDLSVANQAAVASILINNGIGQFLPKTDFDVMYWPKGVVVADLNGDGKNDLITVGRGGTVVPGDPTGKWDAFLVRLNTSTPSPPASPSIGLATAGDAQATVKFTPSFPNGSQVSSFTAVSTPGGITGTCTAPCTQITVNGLVNGTPYTFQVRATNGQGDSGLSGPSNSVTPVSLLTSQTTTFTNPGAQTLGTSPTLTATASSGLSPTFTSSTTGVCTITSGGQLTLLTAGTCTINADQAGNGTYSAAPQVSQSFTINKAGQAMTFTNPGAQVLGTSPTLTASATSGLVPTFTSSTTGVCTITSGGLLTLLTAGTCTINADQAGNGTYDAAPQVSQSFAVNKISQTITFANPGVQTLGTSPALTVTATSGLAPTFTSSTAGVCTITSGGLLTLLTAGTCTINADQAGNGTYDAAPQVSQTFSVNKASQTLGTIGFTPATLVVDGTTTVSATASSGLAVSFSSTTPGVCTVSGTTVTAIAAGTCTIAADQSGNGTYAAAPQKTSDLVVGKATAGVSLGNLNQVYDGTKKAASATTTPGGLAVTFTYDGSPEVPIVVGSYAVVATVNDANYTGSAGGTLVISYNPVAPTLIISTLSDGNATGNETLNIAGSATSPNGVKGVTINGIAVPLENGENFSYAVALHSGINTITTIATDNSDTVSTDVRAVTFDASFPLITVTSPADNSAQSASALTLTGTVDRPAVVTVSVNFGAVQTAVMTGNDFMIDLSLAPGINTITITATDTDNRIGTVKRTIVLDPAAPTVAITQPGQDRTLSQPTLLISGTASDTAAGPITVALTCDGQTYTPQVTNGAFQQQLTFSTDRQYHITATATNPQTGRSVSASRNLIYAWTSQSSGDLNNDSTIDIVDALMALRMSVGLIQPTAAQLAAGDVAPLVNDKPAPDGVIDTGDVLMILKRALGLVIW